MTICPTCGEDFNGIRLFDAHRVGRHAYLYDAEHPDGRRCLTLEEMLAKGWQRNRFGRWTDPSRARDVEARNVSRQRVSHDGVDAPTAPSPKAKPKTPPSRRRHGRTTPSRRPSLA